MRTTDDSISQREIGRIPLEPGETVVKVECGGTIGHKEYLIFTTHGALIRVAVGKPLAEYSTW